jgi:hypothetical protein
MVVLVLCALTTMAVGAVFLVRWRRRRALAAATEMIAALDGSQRLVAPEQVAETARALAADDVAAGHVEQAVRSLWPDPGASAPAGAGIEEHLSRLERTLHHLERNSAVDAGTEQVLLYVTDLPHPGPAVLSAAIQQLGVVVPEHLQAAAGSIAHYVGGGQLVEDLQHVAGGVVREVAIGLASEGEGIAERRQAMTIGLFARTC